MKSPNQNVSKQACTGIDEVRMQACAERLRRAFDPKVLGSDPEAALPYLDDAYRLAHLSPALPRPWPQIAAYRLGHLLMRGATSVDELKRVDKLFEEAGELGVPELGVFPRLYRVAVLDRLSRAVGDGKVASRFAAKRRSLFAQLCATDLAELVQVQQSEFTAMIQGGWHNYLELAAYFCGEPYRLAQGVRSPTGDLPIADEWRVIGSHGVNADLPVRFSKPLAFSELKSREERGAADVFFELDALELGESGLLWVRGEKPVKVTVRELRLLVALCRFRPNATRLIRTHVLGTAETEGMRITDIATRLAKKLRALGLGDPFERGTDSRVAPLRDGIRVVGIAHWKALEAPAPTLRDWIPRSHRKVTRSAE